MATGDEHRPGEGSGDRSGSSLTVENPATGDVVAHAPAIGADDVEELARRARAAQPGWETLGYEGRAAVMRRMRRWVTANRELVIRTIVSETGKAWEDAQVEVVYCADTLGFWARTAERYLADERIRPHSPFLLGRRLVLRYRPYGLVGVIGPWNYPLNNNFGDALPALMAGNAVLLKPSRVTPLTSRLLAEGLRASGLPDDVFLVASGPGAVGTALIGVVDMLHFTGSTTTGRRVMAEAAERPIPVTLELGGKDPMIVLRDAQLERAANAALFGAMHNGGQSCISVERVYVEDAVHDEFVEKVVAKARRLRVGVPTGPGAVDVGAITVDEQLEILERHVRDAVEKGARVEVGGRPAGGPGRFFEPTVLTNVDHSMAIMTEETFGPTLPIMRVSDAEEALRLANDSPYGLNSSLWTRDLERGERLARRIEAGGVCVNDALTNYFTVELPLGGIKESGVGARHGASGIRKYCHSQAILLMRLPLRREPHFFPHSRLMTRLIDRVLVLLYGRDGGRWSGPRRR